MTFIRLARTSVLLTAGAIACSSGPAVRPDEMSADAHRQEATRVMNQANAEKNPPPPNVAVSPNGNPEAYYAPVNPAGPGTDPHAQRLGRHAQQHLAAAAALESFEEGECKAVPPAARAACPLLGPAVAVENVPHGVRVRFSEQANVPRTLEQMRCHLAYARTRGFDSVSSCALYLRGVEIVAEPDGRTIDLISRDPKIATEIQGRTREEAILTGGAW